MKREEAEAWLKGERSWVNQIQSMVPPEDRGYAQMLIAKADAATCEQAYYVLKAYREGLI